LDERIFYLKGQLNHEELIGKEVNSFMPAVTVRDNENFERAFKRFKKACEKSGLMSDIKKHQHFEKPSERKKRKLNAAIRRQRKMLLMEE
jgi:small subunit ribosomal protein S21